MADRFNYVLDRVCALETQGVSEECRHIDHTYFDQLLASVDEVF